jgi:hypothetical protein
MFDPSILSTKAHVSSHASTSYQPHTLIDTHSTNHTQTSTSNPFAEPGNGGWNCHGNAHATVTPHGHSETGNINCHNEDGNGFYVGGGEQGDWSGHGGSSYGGGISINW